MRSILLVVDSQMLIRCGRCRTYNVVPTARLAEEPREALAMVHNRLRGLYIRGKSISCRWSKSPQHLEPPKLPIAHQPNRHPKHPRKSPG